MSKDILLMMKKKVIYVLIIILLISITFLLIPRENKVDEFKQLKYGDSFFITMLRLGLPDKVFEGGTGLPYFIYKLEDYSRVYITFGKRLTCLETCRRLTESETVEIYVKNQNIQ